MRKLSGPGQGANNEREMHFECHPSLALCVVDNKSFRPWQLRMPYLVGSRTFCPTCPIRHVSLGRCDGNSGGEQATVQNVRAIRGDSQTSVRRALEDTLVLLSKPRSGMSVVTTWMQFWAPVPLKEDFIDVVMEVSPSTGVKWEGWGTSLCWWANFAGGLPQDDMDYILDLLFDAKKGLGLNIARYNIGGGAHRSFDVNLRPFGDVPGFQDRPGGPFNWSADERQRKVLLGAVKRGVDVVEAFSNSPPHWMTYSGSVTGNKWWGQENLNPLYYGAFGDYLTEVVKHYRDAWGIEFNSLAPFNEPVEGWWYVDRKKRSQEGCNFSVKALEKVTLQVQHLLREKGLSTKLSGFDAWTKNTVSVLETIGEEALATIQQVNVHTYINDVLREDEAKRTQVRELVRKLGKKLWMSEYGPLNWRGDEMEVALGVARHLTLDLNELQPSAWCYWQALEEPGGGVWGLIQAPFNYESLPVTVQVKKQFFAVMHFSRWIRPGFEIFVPKFEHSFVVIARNTVGDSVVLVATNPSSQTYMDLRFDVSTIAPTLRSGALQVALFLTDVSRSHEELPRLFFETTIIAVRCSVRSITTLVVSAIEMMKSTRLAT